MRGQRVAVVGGSIAGCAAARALHRAGAGEVVVLERADGRLRDRGVGLGLQKERYAELEAAGYLDAGMPWVDLARRPWVVRDGARRAGRTIATMPFPYRSYSWGSLWQELRRRVPDAVDYRTGVAVTAVSDGPDGAVLTLADGREERFDLVVGADGHRSLVRAAVLPGRSAAHWSGYLAWRGTLAVEQLPDPAGAFAGSFTGDAPAGAAFPEEPFPADAATTVAFPGGHMIAYRIPGSPGDGEEAEQVNWVFYATPPTHLAEALADPGATPSTTVVEALTEFQHDLVARHFPGYWQDVVHGTPKEHRLLQPIHDFAATTYTRGHLVLLGDAAALARPHTGSGALKALQDATVLGRTLAGTDSVPAALAAYDAERAPVGRAMLELGRGIGLAHVQRTPDWASLDQPGFEAWWQANSGPAIGGRPLDDRPDDRHDRHDRLDTPGGTAG